MASDTRVVITGMGWITPLGHDIETVWKRLLNAESGIAPTINTGIAHREPGVGQVGAGVVRAPMACFDRALQAFAESVGVS